MAEVSVSEEKLGMPDMLDDQVIVKLSTPLQRGDGKEITEISVREPTAAQINRVGGRTALYQMQDSAHARLLSQITTPVITPQMYNKIKVSDSQKLINAVITFLAGSSVDDLLMD